MKPAILTAVLWGVVSINGTALTAQEPTDVHVVALDPGTSDLLKSYFPDISFRSLVRIDDEPFERLNQRALSMRNATCLVYRGDVMPLKSQLFRERLVAQGIRTVDLAAHLSVRRSDRDQDRVVDFGTSAIGGKNAKAVALVAGIPHDSE